MQAIENFLSNNPGKAFYFLLLLAVPPFFINLGLLPLFADEPTRANVALEMVLSGNFAVPTIGGEYYYNKPPFYNWILAGLYLLSGSTSEFVTRLPAVIPMFLFSVTIYQAVSYFLKDKRIGAVSGILFLVNGRMLLYDSMLGHIDIFYSWLTFISFMAIFYFYQKKSWFLLFLVSYIITAITFLAKGLPSVVFQGFTILTLLIYTGNFRRLFSWQHILSGIICLLIIGAYFYNYSLYNSDLSGYISTIWDQSNQRTAARVEVGKTIKHVLLFPFEHLVHLLPASLLAIFCFNKSFLKAVKNNEFLKYISLIFLANIFVYWISPETRPRYLLMLYPLLFVLWSYAYFNYRDRFSQLNRIFGFFLLGLSLLLTIAVPAALFMKLHSMVSYLELKVLFLLVVMATPTWGVYKLRTTKLLAFFAVLLCVRLAFSWFVLPHRAANNESSYFKMASMEMGRISAASPFYFYQYHPHVLTIPFHDRLIFYIQQKRMQQVNFSEDDSKPGYYLTFDRNLKNPKATLLKAYKNNLKLFVVK